MRPSSVAASFSTTHGRPAWRWCRYGRSESSTASAATPTSTSMPAARSASMPLPATLGSGSVTPTATRLMPAAMIASMQGAVRPVWEQGSSVVYRVAPAGSVPVRRAASRATISAWRPGGGSVAPSKVCPLAATSTAPTHGFGAVVPRTLSPSSTARSMNAELPAPRLTDSPWGARPSAGISATVRPPARPERGAARRPRPRSTPRIPWWSPGCSARWCGR